MTKQNHTKMKPNCKSELKPGMEGKTLQEAREKKNCKPVSTMSNTSLGPMIFRDNGKRTEFAECTL